METRKTIQLTFAATALPSGNETPKFKDFPIEFGVTGERMPANDGLLSGRGKLMRKFVPAVLVLLSLGVLATAASAKPVVVGRFVSTKTAVERNCMIGGGSISTESSGKYSCVNSSTGIATNCSSFGACESVCIGKACGNGVRKPDAAPGNSKSGTAGKPSAGETTTTRNPRDPAGGTTVVRDHRTPVVVNPNAPPPAGAPGAAGGNTTTASPPGPVVRDHRPGGNSANR